MASGGSVLVPVDSEDHVHLLREYRKVLQSTMGPNGSCKAIVTGGGYMEVATSSAALSARLELASPVCKYISQSVVGLADHGLYCGVLLTNLLEQQWSERRLSKNNSVQMLTDLVKMLKELLSSESVCLKLELNSIQNLLPVVKTIMTSKNHVLLFGMDHDKLCVEIIRVFLNSVDEKTNLINRVYTKVESGLNAFTSFKGLLYNLTESRDIEIAQGITSETKIIVFVLKLQDNGDSLSVVMLDRLKQILECSVQLGVKIVGCQKTVSPEIKLFLRRKRIILLERMGTDFTQMLIELSHAFPISQLNIEVSEIDQIVGHLSSIEHIQFNERDYLVLHNEDMSIGTLLVQTTTLLGENSFKALILQSLIALREVAVHPQLTLGGGCLETWIISQIHQLKEFHKEKDFRLVSTWVQKAFQSTCSTVEVDTLYHHGWREDRDSCACGLVERGEVEKGGGAWVPLQEVVNTQVNLQPPRQPNMTLRPSLLVEPHQQKLRVICSVFEAFTNLSDIGLFIHQS